MDAKNVMHCKYFNDTLRKWQSGNTEISAHNLMLPVFVLDQDDGFEKITSMPGVCRYGKNEVQKFLQPLYRMGLKSVLLFGVLNKLSKDSNGSNADSVDNPIVQIIPLLKSWCPNLTIACDVCLCGYTNHGHCGIINEDGSINNLASIKRIAEVAKNYALAGADIVAPSDMMDGRVAAIKSALKEVNLISKVAVLSYSVKYASSFYGPFREAAHSTPSFGDRKKYQLPTGSRGLSLQSAKRDVEEGCDFLMVKPGLPYLDIVRQVKDQFPEFPLFVYQVSGEYSMLHHGGKNNVFNFQDAVMEVLTSIRRAGADCIITYFTPHILNLLNGDIENIADHYLYSKDTY